MNSVFWWLNLVRLYSLYKILYPKRRIKSYSILGTIVSPKKIRSIGFEELLSNGGGVGDPGLGFTLVVEVQGLGSRGSNV